MANKRQKKGFLLPTASEMGSINKTLNLFKSNIFKLKIIELINETEVPKNVQLQLFLKAIKLKISSINPIENLSLKEAIQVAVPINIPFPAKKPDKSLLSKFAFLPPTVFVVGSYLLKNTVNSINQNNVDLAVQMPDSIFQEKDYLNYRYFYKRAFYLAVLAKELIVDFPNLKFQYFNGDERRPILILKSDEKNLSSFEIRIFPVISTTAIPLQKLSPNRNSIRPSTSSEGLFPTPIYNSSILHDTTPISHLNILHQASQNCEAFKETCMLARVWLNQRGLGGQGDVNGFLWSFVVASLLTCTIDSKKVLMNSFSSFQLFKLSLDFLANFDFEKSVLFLTEDGKALVNETEFTSESFKNAWDIVIVDQSGRINLASQMTKPQMQHFQVLAKVSLKLINDPNKDHFEEIFLTKVDILHLEFDHLIKVNVAATGDALVTEIPCDYFSRTHYLSNMLPEKLIQGLNSRVELVAIKDHLNVSQWDVVDDASNQTKTEFFIGLNLNKENCLKAVEYGPPSTEAGIEDAKTKEFKSLWGNKSELRRFKDGSIVESVVFETDGTFEQRSLIIKKMSLHLLQHHSNLLSTAFQFWGDQFFPFLQPPSSKTLSSQIKSFKPIMDTFESLSKTLRQMQDLPLGVDTVIPSSPALRYASTYIPQPSLRASQYTPLQTPIDVVLELESSLRWPDDFFAIQEMKLAFYLKIGERLVKEWPGSSFTVAVDDQSQCGPSSSINGTRSILFDRFLDLKSGSGFLFRCRIQCPRDFSILSNPDNESNIEINQKSNLQVYNHLFNVYPQYTMAIQQLALANPSLPFSIRLLKRFLSSHLLLNSQIPEIIAELLCCRVYLEEDVRGVPCSPFSGFLRTLHFICQYDFENLAVFVDFKRDLGKEEIEVEEERFLNLRREGVAGYIYFWSKFDKPGAGVWIKGDGNTGEVYGRLKKICRACLKHVGRLVSENGDPMDVKQLFVTSATFLDHKLNLKESLLPRYFESITFNPQLIIVPKKPTGFRNLESSTPADCIASLFDPLQKYVEELKRAFGSVAEFYYDFHGGSFVGVKWRYNEEKEFEFKVNLGFSSVPVTLKKGKKRAAMCQVDRDGILGEMRLLGQGLLK